MTTDNNFDDPLETDVLIAALRMDSAQNTDLLEGLASKLTSCMPENVSIKRGGWFISSNRPVVELVVNFDTCIMQLIRLKQGGLSARYQKLVKGVVLKTSEITVDEWFNNLATELTEQAKNNASTKNALSKFVAG